MDAKKTILTDIVGKEPTLVNILISAYKKIFSESESIDIRLLLRLDAIFVGI